jgi:NADP-dependent 3-hydroxy acid dehydrogenase YdfG
MATIGIGPDAVARSVAFAIEQPDDVEIGDITIPPEVHTDTVPPATSMSGSLPA